MPDHRRHRGPHPEDAELFAPQWQEPLRTATFELSWLLTRSYAPVSALKVVGDRHNLSARQRIAVMRSACSDQSLASRRARELSPQAVSGQTLFIDGYNLLTTVEAAMAGAVLLIGRDGAWRDLASMHGTWRKVEETPAALAQIAAALQHLGIRHAHWYLDSPVSNSGRLKTLIAELAAQHAWPWEVELVMDPDKLLSTKQDQIVATADSVILDRCGRWFNLARHVLSNLGARWIVDLS